MNQITGTIGRWQGAGLMATTLLGTGVFILPQMTIDIADSGALLTWAMLTLAIIPITLIFGRLSSIFPHAAGPAYFVEKAFGSIAGRCIGLSFLLLIPIGSAAAILITFKFFYVLVPLQGIAELLVQLALIAFLFLINLKGIQVSAKLQFFLTLTIVAIVAALLSLSGPYVEKVQLSQLIKEFESSTVMTAAGIAFWSFLGVEAMTHLANDFRNPKKDMIPAMLIGTVLVGLIYLACTFLLLLIPSSSSLAMVDTFDAFLGGYGAQVIGLLGLASGLATVNVYSASVARLIWSLSRDRVLPTYFEKLNRHQVPVRALFANLAAMAAAITFTYVTNQALEQLISWTNGVFVIIYAASMFAAFKLLPQRYIPVILLSLFFCLAVAISLGDSMLYAFVILAVLIPSLYWQKRHLLHRPVNHPL